MLSFYSSGSNAFWIESVIVFDILSNIQSIGGRALIVGGAVRDAILGKASKDIDFEVSSFQLISN